MPVPVLPSAGSAAGPAPPDRVEAMRTIAGRCRALRGRITDLQQALPLPAKPRVSDIQSFVRADDLQSAHLTLPGGAGITIVYFQPLVDEKDVWFHVTKPLLSGDVAADSMPSAKAVRTWGQLLRRLLVGSVVIIPEQGRAMTVHIGGLAQRAVGAPTTEREVIAPKEAFVERLETNVGLVRNRLHDPALRVEYLYVGRRSRTKVAMLYLGDVARPQLVRLTRSGLRSIAVDFIRTSMDVAQLTFQHGWTVFPLVDQTERPDRVAARLAEGRLAVAVDGSPFLLIVPTGFWDFQHDGESDLPGPVVATFTRSLRLLGLFMAMALPGLYVAMLSENSSLLPVRLSLLLSATRLAVPYPVATEAIFMLIVADVLAEATTQAASSIGNALAIVGTLIVGQLMVSAHLSSNLMMIVVAASVMGSFLTLKFSLSYAPRIWKYALVLLAAVGGLIGWATGCLLVMVHLASLESAGMPYLAPLSGEANFAQALRIVVRPPRGRTRRRPSMLRTLQPVRARRGGRR